jgi:hypothetical protein
MATTSFVTLRPGTVIAGTELGKPARRDVMKRPRPVCW